MALTEELELDLSGALDSIDRLDQALQSAVQNFKVSLVDALDVLSAVQAPPIEITQVDATPVTEAIDSAVAGSDTSVEATATATDVTSEIDSAVDAADTTVAVVADTGALGDITEQIDTAVAAADAVVPVSADTSDAQAAIEDLGSASEGATEKLGALGGAAKGVQAGTELATGSAVALGEALGGISEGAEVGVGAILALTVGIGELFHLGLDAQSALQRFNSTLGATADVVNHIDIGGLNDSIEEIGVKLGSSPQKIQQMAASFFILGQNSGIAAPKIAETTKQIIALASRAVALNPSLGEVGDVAQTMTVRLQRGGRFAALFGLDLQAAEIQARALKDTGKKTTDQLSIYEKTAAAAAIATEKLGDTIGESVEKGSKNAAITLRSLKEQFEEVLKALGQPLVSPIFDLIKAALPVATSLAQVIGTLAQVAIPAITPVLQIIGKIIEQISGPLTLAIQDAAQPFQDLGDAVTKLLADSGPVFDILTAALVSFVEGVAGVAEVIAKLADAIGPLGVAAAIAAGIIVTKLVPAVAALEGELGLPLLLAVTAVGAALVFFRSRADDSAKAAEDMTQALFGSEDAFANNAEAVDKLNENLDRFIVKGSRFDTRSQIDDLQKLGLTAQQVGELMQQGSEGLNTFLKIAAQHGQIQFIDTDGTDRLVKFNELTKQSSKLLSENEARAVELKNGHAALVDGNSDLIRSFVIEQKALQDSSRAQLDNLVTIGKLSQAQEDQAIFQSKAADGAANYADALRIAQKSVEEIGVSSDAVTPSLGKQAAAWEALALSVEQGKVATQDFQDVADQFGVDIKDVETFVTGVQQAISQFASSAISKLPTVGDALQDLKNKADPKEFIKALQDQEKAINNFVFNVATLINQGFTGLAATALAQGPVIGGALAQGLEKATPRVRAEAEKQLEATQNAIQGATNFINEKAPQAAAAAGNLAQNATSSFSQGLDFGGATQDQIAEIKRQLDNPSLATDAHSTGAETGHSYGLGFADGLTSTTALIKQRVEDLAHTADTILKQHGRVASPSKVWMEIGAQYGEGFALGIESQITPAQEAAAKLSAAVTDTLSTRQSEIVIPELRLNVRTPTVAPQVSSAASSVAPVTTQSGVAVAAAQPTRNFAVTVVAPDQRLTEERLVEIIERAVIMEPQIS